MRKTPKGLLTLFFSLFLFSNPALSAKKPTHRVLLDRAEQFRELGLIPLAREQYKYILETFPKDRSIQKDLKALDRQEIESHFQLGQYAQKVGALGLALLEYDRVLKINPNHTKVKKLRKKIAQENKLNMGLRDLVSNDYLQGLGHYQNNQLEPALESFVRVLNLYPTHKGALTYIEKIGQKLESSQ